jgi:hypothetical protein
MIGLGANTGHMAPILLNRYLLESTLSHLKSVLSVAWPRDVISLQLCYKTARPTTFLLNIHELHYRQHSTIPQFTGT